MGRRKLLLEIDALAPLSSKTLTTSKPVLPVLIAQWSGVSPISFLVSGGLFLSIRVSTTARSPARAAQ